MKTLSFWVVAITESVAESEIVVFDTTLRSCGTGQKLKVHGNPWPIGSKVEFKETGITPRPEMLNDYIEYPDDEVV